MLKMILGTALLAAAGAAQAACPGELVQIRVSKLKAGGSMAGFAEAAKDNSTWYVSHGMKGEKFVIAPIYERIDGDAKPSVTKVMTLHVYATTAAPKHDAAWDAFVAKYDANSSIENTTLVCLPKGTIVTR